MYISNFKNHSLFIVWYLILATPIFFSMRNADGEIISYPATTSIPLTDANWSNQTLAFPKFDPNLGILDNVQINLGGYIASTIEIINHLESGVGIDGHAQTLIIISDVDLNFNSSLDFNSSYFHAFVSGLSGYYQMPNGDLIHGTLGDPWSGSSDGLQYNDPEFLRNFQETGM